MNTSLAIQEGTPVTLTEVVSCYQYEVILNGRKITLEGDTKAALFSKIGKLLQQKNDLEFLSMYSWKYQQNQIHRKQLHGLEMYQ